MKTLELNPIRFAVMRSMTDKHMHVYMDISVEDFLLYVQLSEFFQNVKPMIGGDLNYHWKNVVEAIVDGQAGLITPKEMEDKIARNLVSILVLRHGVPIVMQHYQDVAFVFVPLTEMC